MLVVMFSGRYVIDKDGDGNYFIDRDGIYFNYILNFLRNDQDLLLVVFVEEVLKEVMFYGIVFLIDVMKNFFLLFVEYVVR